MFASLARARLAVAGRPTRPRASFPAGYSWVYFRKVSELLSTSSKWSAGLPAHGAATKPVRSCSERLMQVQRVPSRCALVLPTSC